MPSKKKLSEADIAVVIDCYFRHKGWDLFPEVVLSGFPGRPDYMGVKHNLTMALECKVTLTYPLLEQITRWRHHHDHCAASEFVPASRTMIPHLLVIASGESSGRLSEMKRALLREYRLGYYTVRHERADWQERGDGVGDHGEVYLAGEVYRVSEVVAPKIQAGSRQTAHRLLPLLRDEMKQAVSGLSGREGQYVTPFKSTLHRTLQVLKGRRKEVHIDTVITLLNQQHGGHHYGSDASAKQSLSKFMMDKGLVEQVREYGPWYLLSKKGKALLKKGSASTLSRL